MQHTTMKKYTTPIAKLICLEEEANLLLNNSNDVRDTEDLSNHRTTISSSIWGDEEAQ